MNRWLVLSMCCFVYGCSAPVFVSKTLTQLPSLKAQAENDLETAALFFAEKLPHPKDRCAALISIYELMAHSKHPLALRAKQRGLHALAQVKDLWDKGRLQANLSRALLADSLPMKAIKEAKSIIIPGARTSALIQLATLFMERGQETPASACLMDAFADTDDIIELSEKMSQLAKIAELFVKGSSTQGQLGAYRKIIDVLEAQMTPAFRGIASQAAMGLARVGDEKNAQRALTLLGTPQQAQESTSRVILALVAHLSLDRSERLIKRLVDPYHRSLARIRLAQRFPSEATRQHAETAMSEIYSELKRAQAGVKWAVYIENNQGPEKAQAWISQRGWDRESRTSVLVALAQTAIAEGHKNWAVTPLQKALNSAVNHPNLWERAVQLVQISETYLQGNGRQGALLASGAAIEALLQIPARNVALTLFKKVQHVYIKAKLTNPNALDAMIRLSYRLQKEQTGSSVLLDVTKTMARLNQPARARRLLSKMSDPESKQAVAMAHLLAQSGNFDAAMQFTSNLNTLESVCTALTQIAAEMTTQKRVATPGTRHVLQQLVNQKAFPSRRLLPR